MYITEGEEGYVLQSMSCFYQVSVLKVPFSYQFTFHLLYYMCKKMYLGKHGLNIVYKLIKVSNAHYLIKFIKYKVNYSVNQCVYSRKVKLFPNYIQLKHFVLPYDPCRKWFRVMMIYPISLFFVVCFLCPISTTDHFLCLRFTFEILNLLSWMVFVFFTGG